MRSQGLKVQVGLRSSLLALAATSAFALNGETLVRKGETLTVENTGTFVQDETIRLQSGALGLEKMGVGSYTLPLGVLDAPNPFTLNVREGGVALTDGGALPDEESPTAILNLATFWLDASVNLTRNDKDEVVGWFDCREKQTDGVWGTSYDRATTILQPKNGSGAAYAPVMPRTEVLSGMTLPMVYFGGLTTGTGMNFFKASSESRLFTNIRHVYVVANFQKSYGFVCATTGSGVLLHPSVYNANTGLSTAYCSTDATVGSTAGEFLVNGVECNPLHTYVKKGLQLIEIHAAPLVPMTTFGAIFNDRQINGRYGGDYVGEVLVYDGNKPLTLAERMKVSRYLMKKWGIAPSQGKVTVQLAADTEVALDRLSQASVSGCGTLVKSVSDAASYRPTTANPMAGAKVRIGEGASLAEVRELNYAVRAGDKVTLSTDRYGVHTIEAAVDAAAQEKGEASIDGASENLRFGAIDGGVKTLKAGAQEVILGDSVVGGAKVVPGTAVATIANHSFEDAAAADNWVWVNRNGSSAFMSITTDANVEDWRIAGAGADLNEFRAKYRYSNFYPTDGSRVLVLKQVNVLYGHVTVSRDGDYIFAFDATGRYKYDNMALTFSLVDANGRTNTFARCVVPIGDGFRPYRFPVTRVKAGSYKLVIESKDSHAVNDADSHALLDNLRLVSVGDGISAVGAVPVPNGNFENTYFTSASRVVTNFGLDRLACVGWTLRTTSETDRSDLGVASRLMSKVYNNCDGGLGEWQLRFQCDAGRAVTDAFMLPAGRWRLRCKAGKWGFEETKWNGKTGRSYDPMLGVRIRVNGVEVYAEQTGAIGGFDMHTILFNHELAVTDDDQVTLEVWQARPNSAEGVGAMLNVDDFEFVPADAWGVAPELVTDGTFAYAGKYWNPISQGNQCYCLNKTFPADFEQHYGNQKCDDQYAMLFINAGTINQEIDFPAAGNYRLSFWARSRVSSYSAPSSHEFGGNALRASLIDANQVMSRIVETPPVYSTNFYETVALFKVPAAGKYTLRIEGVNNPNTGVWTGGNKTDANVLIDCVSVKAAPEGGAAPNLPEGLDLQLKEGAKLRLDYDGEATVGKLRIGARKFHGRIDASDPSGLVIGPGVLNVTAPIPGAILIVR